MGQHERERGQVGGGDGVSQPGQLLALTTIGEPAWPEPSLHHNAPTLGPASPMIFGLTQSLTPNRLTQRASDNRPKLQEGLANEAPHFKALATFMGFFYKRHSQVEVLGLLEYLIDMLRNRSSHGLHVRKDPRPATYADCLSPGRSL